MEAAAETTPVREAHRIDEGALAAWMERHVEGFRGPLMLRQFAGGHSNPTYWIGTPGHAYVLRKKPPGKLLPSAHQVEREYRVFAALKDSAVPVPVVRGLCEEEGVIGTAFFVMDYVTGRVFRDLGLPRMPPAERAAIYDQMNAVLAALHQVDWRAAGLSDFGRPGNYYSRQLDRWTKQYVAARTEAIPEMDRLIEWLPANIPSSDDTTLVHGDYRLENMIFHPTEARVLAVIDWELSTLGHPLADLAYNCMPYHLKTRAGTGFNEGVPEGIPSEADYIAAYCRRTGREGIPDWRFYLAFSLFRSAAIGQGVYKRGLEGNASNARALEVGASVPITAKKAWAVVEAG